MKTNELFKGSIKTIVLKLLSEQKQLYGYEIVQEVKKRSNNEVILTEGALYPSLHSLEKDGFLRSEIAHIGNRVRKYYAITTIGLNEFEKRVQEFSNYKNTMNKLLADK